ncbi:MAG: hypothetical protein GQ564_07450 [Bacteroidales bacterium]|nr:hypothetical protein [Bacteroidales bacterium]
MPNLTSHILNQLLKAYLLSIGEQEIGFQFKNHLYYSHLHVITEILPQFNIEKGGYEATNNEET